MKQQIQFNEINYSEIQYKSYFRAITFRDNWLVYILSVCSVVILTYFFGIQAAIFGTIAVVGYFSIKYDRYKAEQWKKFAVSNGWDITTLNPLEDIPYSLTGVGTWNPTQYVVEGEVGGYRFRMYNHKITVGSGKNSRTYFYTILRFVKDLPLPHFLLDNASAANPIRTIPIGYDLLELEGNFSESFKLYCNTVNRVEVLSFVTPDVMQTLLSVNRQQDIEVDDKGIYFISMGDKRDAAALPPLFLSAEAMMKEISHKLKTYRPSEGVLAESVVQHQANDLRIVEKLPVAQIINHLSRPNKIVFTMMVTPILFGISVIIIMFLIGVFAG